MTEKVAHTERVARELMEKAYEHLSEGDAPRAKKIGKKLLKMKYSGGYEVMARALEIEGNKEEARALLEEGVKNVPHVWLLWQQLGNLYSDEGDFAAAESAYDRALACPQVDASQINFNKAIALNRQKRFADAMEALEKVESDDLHWPSLALRVAILNGIGQAHKAADLAKHLVEQILASEELFNRYTIELAGLLTELGNALLESRGDPHAARACYLQALRYVKHFQYALVMLRQLYEEQSPDARHFRVIARGRWPQPLEEGEAPPEFLSTFEAVADTVEEALSQFSELEPHEVQPTLKIEEFEDCGPSPDDLKGVYWRTGYMFFKEEGDEKKET